MKPGTEPIADEPQFKNSKENHCMDGSILLGTERVEELRGILLKEVDDGDENSCGKEHQEWMQK